jgi:hypothetical protein
VDQRKDGRRIMSVGWMMVGMVAFVAVVLVWSFL